MSYQIGTLDIGVAFAGDVSGLQQASGAAGTAIDGFGNKATTSLKGVQAEAKRTDDSMARLAHGIKSAFVGSSVAVGLITLKNNVMQATGAIIDAQVQLDKLSNGFKFGAGGAAGGARELAFVREEANRLGLELGGAASMYMKMVAAARGTTMEGAKTRETFTAIAEAATVMGMSGEQSERAMQAVVQMMSKGKVQAEELRGQLGEHLPGAFAIAARSMGVTEAELNKLLETGQVMSAEFLPKFAAQLRNELGGSVEDATKSMQASLNRFETSWLMFKQNVAQSGVANFQAGQMNILADALTNVSERMEIARNAGGGFWSQTSAGAVGVIQFLNPINAFSYSVASLDERLKEALIHQKELGEYRPGGNIYLNHEIYQTQQLVRELKEAKNSLDNLRRVGTGASESRYSALVDAEALKKQQAQGAAYAELMTKLFTPQQKFVQATIDAKKTLGELYTPEVERMLREQYIKPTRSAAEETAVFARALDSVQEKSMHLNTNYTETITALNKGYQGGRFGAVGSEDAFEKYSSAVNALIKQQPFFIKGVKDEASAVIDAAQASNAAWDAMWDANEKARLATEERIKTGREALEQIQFETSLLGMNTQERAVATAMRDLERRGVVSGTEAYTAYADAIKKAVTDRESLEQAASFWSSVESTAKGVWTSVADGGMSAFKRIGQTLKSAVLDVLWQMTGRQWLISIGTAAGIPGAALAGQQGGGAGGIAAQMGSISSLGSLYNAVTNGINNGVTAGFSKLMSGDFGQKIGMSYYDGNAYQLTGTGQNVGSMLGGAGNALAGYGLQKAISGGYKTGESGLVDALTVAASAYFGPLAGVAAGVFNRAFGRKLADTGIEGSFGGEAGFTGQQYEFYKGGWFRSDKTKYSAMDAGMQAAFADQFKGQQVQTALMAQALGQGTEAIASFTRDVKISFQGLTQEQITEKLQEQFATTSDALASLVLGGNDFAKTGETATQTLARLSTSLTTVNQISDTLGWSLQTVSLAGGNAASTLADKFGGLEAMTTATSSYYDNFYSEAERTATATRQLTSQLAALGVTLPETRDAYRDLVDGAMASGNEQLAADLIKLSGAYASVSKSADDLAASMTQATSSIASYLERLDTTASGNSGVLSLSAAQGLYATQLNAAKAGDTTAMGNLGSYADSVIKAATEQLPWLEAALVQGRVRSDLRELISGARAFAVGGVFSGGGIVSGPTAFPIGIMGEKTEEAIMPLANVGGVLGVRMAGGGDASGLGRAVAAMAAEIKVLRDTLEKLGVQTVINTANGAASLARLVNEGVEVWNDPSMPLTTEAAA